MKIIAQIFWKLFYSDECKLCFIEFPLLSTGSVRELSNFKAIFVVVILAVW